MQYTIHSKVCVKFNKRYLMLTFLLFIIELIIGIYVHDKIIRPYIGDLLVVIFLYCLLKSFIEIPLIPAAIGVLIFAYIVEISQYFDMVDRIGLGSYKLARIIIGTSFSWTDMLCYTIGIGIVIITENVFAGSK